MKIKRYGHWISNVEREKSLGDTIIDIVSWVGLVIMILTIMSCLAEWLWR